MATSSHKRPLELSADALEEGPVTKKARVDEDVEEEEQLCHCRFCCVIVEAPDEHDGMFTYIVQGDKAGLAEFKRLMLDCKDFDDAHKVALTRCFLGAVAKGESLEDAVYLGFARRDAATQEEYAKAVHALQERVRALEDQYALKATKHAPNSPAVGEWVMDVDGYLVIEGLY
jgi:hypothetical protein